MLYVDDDAKKEFSKAIPLLQVVCAYLEYEAAKFDGQVKLIENCEHIAIVQLDNSNLTHICEKVNKAFKRKDSDLTCTLSDFNRRIITIMATHPADIDNLL